MTWRGLKDAIHYGFHAIEHSLLGYRLCMGMEWNDAHN
jgi:hypothetical protein